MRRLVAVLCVALVACAGEVGTTTVPTVAPTAAPTVTTTTTTTTVPGTTTTTMPVTTTTEASEVPAELLALIGAPMPEVDLTIEGPEDVERWLQEFLRWEEWSVANPIEGAESIGQFASGFYLQAQSEGLPRLIEAEVVSVGGGLEVRSTEPDFTDVEIGVISVVFETTQRDPIFTLAAGSLEVLHVQKPSGVWVVSDAVLVQSQDGRWLLSEFFSR